MLIYVFSIQLGWLPSARMGTPWHYVLPTITLGAFLVAGMMRLVRSSVLEVLDTEFVKSSGAFPDWFLFEFSNIKIYARRKNLWGLIQYARKIDLETQI